MKPPSKISKPAALRFPPARSASSSLARILAVAVAIAFLVLLFSPTALKADEFHRTERFSVRMFSFGTLTINTRMGDLDIQGWDDPRLSVEAEKVVRAGSRKKAAKLYGRVKVRIEGRDHKIKLSTIYPRRKLWRPFRGESKLSVNFTIRMPYDSNLRLKCVDGDVTVSSITGLIALNVNYGDVEVDVPDVYALRLLDAHAWLGYVQSDLHGMAEDSAGFGRSLSFNNLRGTQTIIVRVRMGGVFIYGDASGYSGF